MAGTFLLPRRRFSIFQEFLGAASGSFSFSHVINLSFAAEIASVHSFDLEITLSNIS